MKKNFYITTSIFYASGKPHIGNTYEGVLTDAIARYKKLKGYNVTFQTGTDEHGQKVQNTAEKHQIEPQKFVDNVSLEVKRILGLLNVNYTKFARTTNLNHKEAVQKIFDYMYKKGDIYKGYYEGLYCTPCESFFTKSQLVDGKCPDCGRNVQETKEEAYFLKLSKYSDWLKRYIEEHDDFIVPTSRKNEMIKFIEQGLEDLCVSRTSFNWGIQVPFDKKHVVYVWLDALSNYITFVGYLTDTDEFNKNWPANIHIIGKDILRFHAIYWPIILKSLDLPLPSQIYAHPFLVDSKGEKMSKSKGNVLYADELVNYFGVDTVRYYLLSEIGTINDGNIGYELIIDRYNSDLANTLGNLVNRTISMSKKYFEGIVYEPTKFDKMDEDLIKKTKNLSSCVEENMNKLKISSALEEIFNVFRRCNKYIDETTPWILAKEGNEERLKTVLYNLLESIRVCAVLLQPFLPETANNIFDQLNTQNKHIESVIDFKGMDSGIKLNDPKPIFERIDKQQKLEEISKTM